LGTFDVSLRGIMSLSGKQALHCRVCDNPDIRVIDHIETPNCDTAVPVCHCKACGHFSLFPTQYQQQKAFEWDGVNFYLKNLEQRRKAAAQVLDRLIATYRKSNRQKPASFLDVGCAIGLSLPLAQARGLRAMGIEPEARLAEYGRDELGADIHHGVLGELDPSTHSFDLVYCEQVLEHVAAPDDFLAQLGKLLTPGGLLYIGVPPVFPLNRLSTFLIRKLHIPLPMNVITNIFHDPDEHISVFTRRSLQRLADISGMQLRLLPLTFSTLSVRRVFKHLLTLGSSPGTYLLSRQNFR
jgi:SAM-dependent methyltransferase